MRAVPALVVAAATVSWLVSCERNPVEEYGKGVTGAYKGAQKVEERTSIQNLQESIRAFHAANGRYPNDLKELSDFAGLSLEESTYSYSPSDGTIRRKEKSTSGE